MLDGINEFADQDCQRRWMIRRCVVSVILMVVGYVGSWIPVEYYLNTRSSPAIAQLKPIVMAYYRPLDMLRPPRPGMWSPSRFSRSADYLIQVAEQSCQRVDNASARWAAKGYPVSASWVVAGLVGLVVIYALSPVPLLWVIKFLAIEQVNLVAHLFEWYCVPIELLNTYSATARSFYEEYAELFALTH